MSEFKGTKGKWEVNQDVCGFEDIIVSNYKRICEIKSYGIETCINGIYCTDPSELERQYNSLLISSAPELLDMVKLLVERMEENDLGHFSAVQRAKELIKKATEL